MNETINQKLNELEALIQKDAVYQEARELKTKLLKDSSIMKDIEELKKEDIYSKKYMELKKKLYEHEDYQRYQELENMLYYLTLEINQILNQLTGKKVCEK